MGAAELEEAGRILHKLSLDVGYVASQLTVRTRSVEWKCAKSERFHAAIEGRRREGSSIAAELEEFSRAVKAQARLAAESGG